MNLFLLFVIAICRACDEDPSIHILKRFREASTFTDRTSKCKFCAVSIVGFTCRDAYMSILTLYVLAKKKKTMSGHGID